MKRNIRILISVVAAVVVIVAMAGCNIESVKDHYSPDEDLAPEIGKVKLSIDCSSVFEEENYGNLDEALKKSGVLPEDGWIFPETEVTLREGDTLFDILYRIVREKQIQFEYHGNLQSASDSVYVKSIGHLSEFACGEMSGWGYTVNGEMVMAGCTEYQPKDGDVIAWSYVCTWDFS